MKYGGWIVGICLTLIALWTAILWFTDDKSNGKDE